MKRRLQISASILLMVLMSFVAASAQSQSPVKWKATAKMVSAREGIITLTATIDKGWHLYGLTQPEDGPVATKISFAGSKGVTFKGQLKHTPAPVSQMDEMFGAKVSFWSNKVTFTKRFRITGVKTANATITVSYMACNDQSCRPPSTETITVKLK